MQLIMVGIQLINMFDTFRETLSYVKTGEAMSPLTSQFLIH